MDRDYHMTMCDISHLCWIVENEEICLDNNDVISVRLWVTKLQQCGARAVLKDKTNPPPPESRLSQDSFVLCIQTEFQRDCFCMLGSNFLSIDATHNTTQYTGVQLFTLIVRDLWGHGALCGTFLFTDAYFISTWQVFLSHGCCCQMAWKRQFNISLIL